MTQRSYSQFQKTRKFHLWSDVLRGFRLVLCILFPACFLGTTSEAEGLSVPAFVDLGQIRENHYGQKNISIQNQSSQVISIKKLTTNCGCTHLKLNGDSNIAPAETRDVTVECKFGSELGGRRATGKIEWTNASGNNSESYFQIRGQVVSPLILETALVQFNKIDIASAPREIQIVAHRGNSSEQFDSIQAQATDGLIVETEQRSKSMWIIKVRLLPLHTAMGAFHGTVELKLLKDNREICDRVLLPVAASITGPIIPSTNSIYFGVLKPSESFSKPLVLRSDSLDLSTVVVMADKSCITTDITSRIKNEASVIVHVAYDDQMTGQISQKITVKAVGVDHEMVIPILGYFKRDEK